MGLLRLLFNFLHTSLYFASTLRILIVRDTHDVRISHSYLFGTLHTNSNANITNTGIAEKSRVVHILSPFSSFFFLFYYTSLFFFFLRNSFIFIIYLFIHLFLAVLGLHFCARAFSSCGKRGPPFIALRGPLTIAASPVAEHRLQTHRLSSCGSRAQLLRGMWDPPRPGLEPASPALAGRFSTTAPPGKPHFFFFYSSFPCC